MLQRVAVCCRVILSILLGCDLLQCVAVYYLITLGLHCVTWCCSVLQCVAECYSMLQCVAEHCSVLQCVAVCYNVLHGVTRCSNVLRNIAVCYCVAVKCSRSDWVAKQCR